MDMITINWTIKNGMGVLAPPAVGSVQFHLPTMWADADAIYADATLTDALELDGGGEGSITIPDPRSTRQLPQGATISVSVETDAWQAYSVPLCVPEGDATTFTLQELMGLVVTEGGGA